MMKHKKKEMVHAFKKRFGTEPRVFTAPGRINVIGEHTDYNNGWALPAAIDLCVGIYIQKNTTGKVNLIAFDIHESYTFHLTDEVSPVKQEWVNYFLGVWHQVKAKGTDLAQGFDLIFSSDIPMGAGLSSSAALECGFGVALSELYGLGLSKIEIATMGQRAEHDFVGVKCGIMDQFASTLGKAAHVIKLDCRSLAFEYYPADFKNYDLILFDSNVKHNLASSEYNVRRAQCEQGVVALQKVNPAIQSLRDASLDDLQYIRTSLDTTSYQRCAYVIKEIARVEQACLALQQSDFPRLGALMYDTHEGLSKEYEVSCAELDFLVETVRDYPAVLGARMMGGGFGGCSINLIDRRETDAVVQETKRRYKTAFEKDISVYQVKISDGVKALEG